MQIYLYLIIAYLLVLLGFNFYRSRKVKNQEDFMVAGRSLSLKVMVFTLICTWIGSGTFIGGAEFAAKAGFSSLWMPAGAWVGIIIIYFLAGKIRTFGQYTIGDILEVRYGKFARIFGAIALIISFTAIVSYQFKAGGFILDIITDHAINTQMGTIYTAVFVIIFTASAGMLAVAYTDLPNGIIIVLACIISLPFTYFASGGMANAVKVLPHSHFTLFGGFGSHPTLKVGAYFLSTMLLLLGIQSMYQKFYSAKSPKEAKQSVILWVIGTIIVESVVVFIAVFASVKFWPQISEFISSGGKSGVDPAAIVLLAARKLVPTWVGVFLLAAACAVVLSTGMNYLLSPTTNMIRDIYQKFINKDASQKSVVLLQKILIVILGIFALYAALNLESVLETAYFAYTIYGVAITPALIAALAWKRATKLAGNLSIILGTVAVVFLKLIGYIYPHIMVPFNNPNGDPWGIPIIYPSIIISLGTLILVSYLTPPPSKEVLKTFFPDLKESEK